MVLSHPSALIPCSTVFSLGILQACSQPSEAGTRREQAHAGEGSSLGHPDSLTHVLGSAAFCTKAICHLALEWGDLHPRFLGCLSLPGTSPAIHALCAAAFCASVGPEGGVTLPRGVVALWPVLCGSFILGLDELIAMVVLSMSLTLTPLRC